MKRIKGQTGMSLVEATIILLVLMLLTSVLAPSIMDYYRDAQGVKVKEDCEAIGVTVMRLVRDVGSCLKLDGTKGCTLANRADVLVSDGPVVGTFDAGTLYNAPSGTTQNGSYAWIDPGGANAYNRSPMVAQFVTNAVGYTDAGATNPAGASWPGPQFSLGWRGAYLSSPIGPDPWGLPYFVNSLFLSVATDATGSGIGGRTGYWPNDVFCISAGINMIFETPFGGSTTTYGTNRGGDDFVYVISGGTR